MCNQQVAWRPSHSKVQARYPSSGASQRQQLFLTLILNLIKNTFNSRMDLICCFQLGIVCFMLCLREYNAWVTVKVCLFTFFFGNFLPTFLGFIENRHSGCCLVTLAVLQSSGGMVDCHSVTALGISRAETRDVESSAMRGIIVCGRYCVLLTDSDLDRGKCSDVCRKPWICRPELVLACCLPRWSWVSLPE